MQTTDVETLRGFQSGDERACRQVAEWAADVIRHRYWGIGLDERKDIIQLQSIGSLRGASPLHGGD
jgi:hypothetical protein